MTGDETRFQETGAKCPVCQWPGQGTPTCRICGWQMIGGYVAGAATPADHQALASRLAEARQQHDIQAAVRAVSADGGSDPARLAWLAGCARGGAPSASQLERMAAAVVHEDTRRQAASPGVDYTLVRLVAGEIDGITFVEVGPDGISSFTLVTDPLGRPRRRPRGVILTWSGLLSGLPAEIDLARFQLAGGIGSADAGPSGPPSTSVGPAALSEGADSVIARALATLLEDARESALGTSPDSARRTPQLDVVLVRRAYDWPVLDVMIKAIWAQARPVTEIYQGLSAGILADIVDRLATRAPLRHAYDLVLIKVDATSGEIGLDPCELFPAGAVARPGHAPEVPVDVVAPPHAADVVELPIVARRGDVPADWPRVDSHYLDGTVNNSTRLRISLRGPGQLSVRATPALPGPSAVRSSWPQQYRRLPPRLQPVPALDVAFLVELGGYNEASVARRIRLVRDVIGALGAAAISSAAVEVALFGYRDHFGEHSADVTDISDDRDKLVVDCGLTSIPAALDFLGRLDLWRSVPVRDDYAAPVEDALHQVAEGAVRWRPGTRHLLFIVGSRPPHPHRAAGGLVVQPCWRKLRWRDALDVLRSDFSVECVLVVDDPPRVGTGRKYIQNVWRDVTAAHRFAVGSADPARMVQAVGLVPANGSTRLGLAVRTRHGSRGVGR